ncbi:aminodeoxychorismate synthase component I [bacterium]|nr:aminodeoxychorismate synthase component I [bacterium]
MNDVRVKAVMREGGSGCWLTFDGLHSIVTAHDAAGVADALRRIEREVEKNGIYAAGYVSYEAAPAFDAALAVKQGGVMPLLWFGLFDEVAAGDCLTGGEGADAADVSRCAWAPDVTPEAYVAAIARIKELIAAGDTYQVNYTHRLSAQWSGDPWQAFLRLVAAQDAPYGAFIDTGEFAVCSASPELFFSLDGARIVSKPMKGTCARGMTYEDDRARAAALRASEKERAENLMIVDMVRHDLGRIARTGSVRVPRLFDVEQYPTVWQMTSTVEAETDADVSGIFTGLFPPASITGAPKVRTMEIIRELETSPRGVYTGAVGFIAPGRRAQFNVAIRTLVAERAACRAEYGVGGGIVWDSRAEREWQECLDKARILREPPTPAFSLLETLLWEPGKGYVLLDRHLRRLAESSAYFGFGTDIDAAREALERAAGEAGEKPRRVRLLARKDGSVMIEMHPVPARPRKPQRVAFAASPVERADPFLHHKTTHRRVYENALASRPGYGDVLLFNERGEVTESTIANVVVEIDGVLCTPPLHCGLLAGTMRAELLERGEITEQVITVGQVRESPRVLLVNSVRGMYEVRVV